MTTSAPQKSLADAVCSNPAPAEEWKNYLATGNYSSELRRDQTDTCITIGAEKLATYVPIWHIATPSKKFPRI